MLDIVCNANSSTCILRNVVNVATRNHHQSERKTGESTLHFWSLMLAEKIALFKSFEVPARCRHPLGRQLQATEDNVANAASMEQRKLFGFCSKK